MIWTSRWSDLPEDVTYQIIWPTKDLTYQKIWTTKDLNYQMIWPTGRSDLLDESAVLDEWIGGCVLSCHVLGYLHWKCESLCVGVSSWWYVSVRERECVCVCVCVCVREREREREREIQTVSIYFSMTWGTSEEVRESRGFVMGLYAVL